MPTQGEPKEANNTDRELWRERDGDYYAASLHVTEGGGIGMDVGGTVTVRPIREWHKMAIDPRAYANVELSEENDRLIDEIERLRAALTELADAAAHDLRMNQGGDEHEDEPESSGGWWSSRCDNAIRSARAVLGRTENEQTRERKRDVDAI